MQIVVKALVLKEVKYKDADRILTLLTPDIGIISAIAKGALRPRNKLFSATGLFCYSNFVLFEGRNMYTVNEADPINLFFGLRESIEAVSLATYMTQILQILSPTQQEAEELLKLTLNSFYMLCNNKRSVEYIKAVFELRSLSLAGFMPDVLSCSVCEVYESDGYYFDEKEGSFLCESCAHKYNKKINLDASAMVALRHTIWVDSDKLFNFTLAEKSLKQLANVAEKYLLWHLDYPPKSLDFLKTMLN